LRKAGRSQPCRRVPFLPARPVLHAAVPGLCAVVIAPARYFSV